MRRVVRVTIMVVVLSSLALPALAHFNNWHTENGYYHGHGSYGVPGTQTEGKTEKSGDSQNKYAAVRNGSTGVVLCSHTTAGSIASCIANISVSNADSRHSGAGLALHTMS
jgi:hypothetical protein